MAVLELSSLVEDEELTHYLNAAVSIEEKKDKETEEPIERQITYSVPDPSGITKTN